MSTNRPSFAEANQVVTLTRVTPVINALCYWVDLVVGHFGSYAVNKP